MASRWAWLAACVLTAACGQKASQDRARAQDAGPAVAVSAQEVALPVPPAAAVPLGLATLEAFRYRAGAGAAALRDARRALAAGDDERAITAAREALARDPQALEAAWVLARALARRGHAAEAVVALAPAVAGDPGAWAAAALADPALAALLAGGAWRAHLDELRAGYEAAVGDALAAGAIVRSAGELFAYDGRAGRWLRLTHTEDGPDGARGAVTAALVSPAARVVIYVTEAAGPRPARAVGVLAPSPAASTAPIGVPGAAALVLAYRVVAPTAGVWLGIGTPPRWSALADGRLAPLAAKVKRPPGARVELVAGRVRRIAGAVAGVSADWDDHARASAVRLTASARTIAAPGEALIEGNTIAWSPGRTHLAFAAQLGEACVPSAAGAAPDPASAAAPDAGPDGAATAPPIATPIATPVDAPVDAVVYVVEVATGKLTELARGAGGLAPQWLSERRLAIAGPAGLTLVDLDGAAPVVVRDAGLAAPPARPPGCEPAPSPR